MVKKAKVVIGAGYGDEGKGLMTDYFAAAEPALVVRFNGGAQAGHTVRTPSGQRHVFHHLGSGAFAGAATYLSRHFAVNPPMFLKEQAFLQPQLGTIPEVFVDNRAPVTTFYDMLVNQIVEDFRANGRHGSCGMGFGETIGRNERPEFQLTVADLHTPAELRDRLRAIRDQYLPARLTTLGVPKAFVEANEQRRIFATTDVLVDAFLAQAALFLDSVVTVSDARQAMDSARRIVMEGAQGLMLDMDRGAFPYVTRSNTGLTNALEVAHEAQLEALDVTYVTRAYLTRHGAGPMAHELAAPPYALIEDLTNQPNLYQGALRFAYLDHDVLEAAIRQDLAFRNGPAISAQLAVTCLDQLDRQVQFWRNGELYKGSVDKQLADLEKILPVSYRSYGPTRNTVVPASQVESVA